jgi:hypothetical protein
MKFDNDIRHCQFYSQTYSNYNNFELRTIAYHTIISHFVILIRILHFVSNIAQFTSLFITDTTAGRKVIPLVCIYILLVYWEPSNYF